ncbi:MAG: tRNA (adenosine(37)-N6)-dimethylallyltransferase MiaA [Clostridiales bacterium]|nr:tRNA (adenosine(37)-N6)-dimethylallyltransferase MiaA [Clostridiales bacterium]
MFKLKKVLVICGPTASGKTDLAVKVAKKLNTEVISADSQLIYKGLDIGTAKPTKEEMQGVIHHMMDIVEPTQSFSVSDYEEKALPIVERLLKEEKTPIICGGTGFYINSLLYNLSYGNAAANEEVRKKYENILEEKGRDYLFDLLKEKDLETAQKLHPNDTKRVIRALEIFEVSGQKKSEIRDELKPRFDFVAVMINYPREELYERINKRVDIMIDNGLLEEVRGLLNCGISKNHQCMQAIGYKEVLESIENGYNLSTMCDIIRQNTRRYAKRQITFFKKLQNLHYLTPSDKNMDEVLKLLQ